MASSEQIPPAKPQRVGGPWILRSSRPVTLPAHFALTASEDSFRAFLKQDVRVASRVEGHHQITPTDEAGDAEASHLGDGETVLVSDVSTTADIRDGVDKMDFEAAHAPTPQIAAVSGAENNANPFVQGLMTFQQQGGSSSSSSNNNPSANPGADDIPNMQNRMRTGNGDMAYRSTDNALLDLYTELEDVVSGPRLRELLYGAWRKDPLATLKIIFHARSIHLGKASRHTFYRCAGWLAENHPQTLIANLPWLNRPVIPKKADKPADKKRQQQQKQKQKEEEVATGSEDDMVIIEDQKEEVDVDENDASRYDVKHGVAHGYWKDLLNMLVLRVNDQLTVLANPRDLLNDKPPKQERVLVGARSQADARQLRHAKRAERNAAVTAHFAADAVYRGLHLAVARLFAAQLHADLALLAAAEDTGPQAKRAISLCAKWAPSLERFHDKHTHIASSIAEILHPLDTFPGAAAGASHNNTNNNSPNNDPEQRTLYLRHAREAYRKNLAALRAHLEVVERDLTASTYGRIQYDRLPSLAMKTYAPLFMKKDAVRFEAYMDRVAAGTARISGATLLPSTLIKEARDLAARRAAAAAAATKTTALSAPLTPRHPRKRKRKQASLHSAIQEKSSGVAVKLLDGQWRALVQRVRDAGTLDSCMAVVDVSDSMGSPQFRDGTCPMDSAIGLGLLLAEVCRPPFGGCLVTFSEAPSVVVVEESASLVDKYETLARMNWSMSTDFVAVFEKLILPMAVEKKVKPEDMVKRVFVFSDMQFNQAQRVNRYSMAAEVPREEWNASSYERIRKAYREAGYEMPELVFWNLAGGRAGYNNGRRMAGGDPTAPKPVLADEVGTALVSGYSQGTLKVFLNDGTFDDEDKESDEEEVVEEIGEDDEVVLSRSKAKEPRLDPVGLMERALGHKAYRMLCVVD